MMGNRTHEPSSTTEDPDRYAENGLHPVLIDDELKGGRYRVVHKLGAGSFSTVWLARDNEKDKYVSLKILAAERPIDTKELAILKDIASSTLNHPGRQFVVCLTDEFVIEGPNGKHVCLVTEVAGQRLSKTQSADESSLKQSRSIGFQLAQALGFLDDLKIVHAGKSSQ
jgi:serine/threonine-protein kinase SRPK3